MIRPRSETIGNLGRSPARQSLPPISTMPSTICAARVPRIVSSRR